jgi:hypothetical protein
MRGENFCFSAAGKQPENIPGQEEIKCKPDLNSEFIK